MTNQYFRGGMKVDKERLEELGFRFRETKGKLSKEGGDDVGWATGAQLCLCVQPPSPEPRMNR